MIAELTRKSTRTRKVGAGAVGRRCGGGGIWYPWAMRRGLVFYGDEDY